MSGRIISQYSGKRGEGSHTGEHWREKIGALACGFLMARGIAGSALSAGWSMAALMGSESGRIFGAMLFGVCCLLVYVLCCGSGAKANGAVTLAVCALYFLWQVTGQEGEKELTSAMSCIAVGAAVILVGRHPAGIVQPVLTAMALLMAWLVPTPEDVFFAVRIDALIGGMASAGLCGTALAGLTGREIRECALWTAAGMAIGLL